MDESFMFYNRSDFYYIFCREIGLEGSLKLVLANDWVSRLDLLSCYLAFWGVLALLLEGSFLRMSEDRYMKLSFDFNDVVNKESG